MSYRFIFVLILVVSFFLGCSKRQSYPNLQNETDTISDEHPAFIMLLDSTMVPYDSICWDTPLDYVVFPYSEDTLFTDTFQLKNNYQLILFPAANGYTGNKRIHYGHYARLVGEGIDSVITNSYGTEPSKYWLRYDSIDFDNCFAIEYSGGGNFTLYIELFEKKTGKLLISGYSGTYDIENGLILYLDEEEEMNVQEDTQENKDSERKIDSGVTLYDIRKNEKIKFKTPYNPCFGTIGYWACYKITKVTPSMVYLRYDCCDNPITIKVKRK